jgi:hypothetical protein
MSSLSFDELNNMIEPVNDDMLVRTLFSMSIEGKDICSECNEKSNIVSCNKCGNPICNKNTCSSLFPHYKNTLYAICYSCSKEISDKMKLVIDMNKLSLLKNKIKTRRNSSDEKQSPISPSMEDLV